jgi:hypothetical protein
MTAAGFTITLRIASDSLPKWEWVTPGSKAIALTHQNRLADRHHPRHGTGPGRVHLPAQVVSRRDRHEQPTSTGASPYDIAMKSTIGPKAEGLATIPLPSGQSRHMPPTATASRLGVTAALVRRGPRPDGAVEGLTNPIALARRSGPGAGSATPAGCQEAVVSSDLLVMDEDETFDLDEDDLSEQVDEPDFRATVQRSGAVRLAYWGPWLQSTGPAYTLLTRHDRAGVGVADLRVVRDEEGIHRAERQRNHRQRGQPRVHTHVDPRRERPVSTAWNRPRRSPRSP